MSIKSLARSLYIKFRIYVAGQTDVHRVYTKYYGVKIGANSRFTGKKISFGGEPYLVEIGDDVTITSGVKFQTHDGGVALFRKEHPGLNVFGKIIIGNNVFIGEDTMIMYNVTIGNNVVIGARSVVTKDIPDNSLAVGVPARVIKPIDAYKESSLQKSIIVLETDPKKREAEILDKLKRKLR